METQDILFRLNKSIRKWNHWRAINPNTLLDLRGQNMEGFRFVRNSAYSASEDSEGVDLWYCNFSGSNLKKAHFYSADLRYSDFSDCILEEAELWHTDLSFVVFSSTRMAKSNLSHARLSNTIFTNVDLSEVVGLDKCVLAGPTFIDARTIMLSKNLPQSFIENAGYPIDIQSHLAKVNQQRYYSCFISYSRVDENFAIKLYEALKDHGIKCWLDQFDARIGSILADDLYRAIQGTDRVLLCCSENSLKSFWVDKEVSMVIEKEVLHLQEKSKKLLALIPLDLDGYMFSGKWTGGKASIIKERVAARCTGWEQNEQLFELKVSQIIEALKR